MILPSVGSKVLPGALYLCAVLHGRVLLRRIPNTALVPAVTVFVIATIFVILRTFSVGDGDIGSFVSAGDLVSSGASLPLQEGVGYDGQFYYRMAIDPLNFDLTVAGVRLDTEMRLSRIGYPAVVWLASLGGLVSVPLALVVVNVLGLAAIAGLGGLLAQRFGRHALWGISLALYYGFAFTLSKDLTEIIEVMFLLLGLLAAHKHRFVLSALALSGAVLTRESALLFVPVVAAWRLFTLVKQRQRPSGIDLTWIVPPLAFGLWQLVVRMDTGRFPLAAERENTLNVPGWPLLRALPRLVDDLSWQGVVHLAEVFVLVAVIVFALMSLRRSAAEPLEKAVFLGLALACLSVDIHGTVWAIRSVRMFADAFVMATLILLATRRRLALAYVVAAVGAVSATTYGHFVFNL